MITAKKALRIYTQSHKRSIKKEKKRVEKEILRACKASKTSCTITCISDELCENLVANGFFTEFRVNTENEIFCIISWVKAEEV